MPEDSTIDERDPTSGRRLIGGGAMLAAATMGASGGNYLLNLLLGRWLSPSAFADANLMVTLMLLVTGVAAPLQLVAARYTGMHEASGTPERGRAIVRWLNRRAAVAGMVLALVLGPPALLWARVFNTGSPWPFVILAVGMPAYLTQAVRRGALQGHLRFAPLAASFLIEMSARLGIAVALVAAGFGVVGATTGLSVSFLATWAMVRSAQPFGKEHELSRSELGELRRFVAPTAFFLFGQILINNGDVLVVKIAFDGEAAGVYSAVALMGRAVFFLSWSAVATLFPAAAQRNARGTNTDSLLIGGLVVVAGCGAVMVAGAALYGDLFFRSMFGPEFTGVEPLLVRYATATSLFAVANLVVTQQISLGRLGESRILVAIAVGQTIAVVAGRSNLATIVDVQVVAMALLAAATLGSALVDVRRRASTAQPSVAAMGTA